MKDEDLSLFGFFKKSSDKKDKNKDYKEKNGLKKDKVKNEVKYQSVIGDKEKKEQLEVDKDTDISIDFAKFFVFLKKYSYLFLLLIPIILSIYLRTMPANLPIAEKWASSSIEQGIKNNILDQLRKQYPNLPTQNLMPLVEEQYKAVYSQQKDAINNAILQNAEFIRQYFRDNKGVTYLGDIDSYYWLRYARNIVEKGHIEDEKIDGLLIDNHMLAPLGSTVIVNIYPYVIAYVHKFLSFFNKDITIMQSSFYTPIILSIFTVIIAFLLGRKLSGDLAGLIASVLIAVNPTLLSRTLGSDNDLTNIIFPLIVMLFTLYAFDSKDFVKKAVFSALAGLFVGIYGFGWSGWWFIFLFLIVASIIYLVYTLVYEIYNFKDKKSKVFFKYLIKNESIKSIFIFLIFFMIFTFIGLSFFGLQEQFFRSFTNPFNIVKIKQAAKPDLWPNVYTTVAEMNEADFNQIVNSFGGVFFILIAFLGTIISITLLDEKNRNKGLLFLGFSTIYYLFIINTASNLSSVMLMILIFIPLAIGLLISIIYKTKVEPMHSILLIIWFMATIYASIKGVRFIVLILPAFAVSFAVFFSEISNKLSLLLSKLFDIRLEITKILVIIIAGIFLIQPINMGYATAYNYVPSINDAWVETLTKINQESKENAIINSWWDFGHWFKYFADRAVTFDGASQNKPQAHWIGKVLLTNDEKQAVAILRMLDCEGNKAFYYIDEELNDTHESVKLVYRLLNMSKEEAKKDLSKRFSEEKVNKILNAMYCEPPENFFITSEDMVGKAPVWGHFGLWNFERADYYNYYRTNNYNGFIKSLKEEYNLSENEAKKIYYELAALRDDRSVNDWIASWPGYFGSARCNEKNNENLLVCNIGLPNNQVIPINVNLTNMEAYVSTNNDKIYPNAFSYIDTNKKELAIKKYDKNKLGYGISLLSDNRTVILMSEELVGSMFTRLFYYDGYGLKYFDKFYDITDITGLRIITWKIDWQGKI
ncbi:MAG: STT3 domain-containing protein [Candidatus Woesearchaeota archaeon]